MIVGIGSSSVATRNGESGVPGLIWMPVPPVRPKDCRLAREFCRTGVLSLTLISTCTLRASSGLRAKDWTSPTLSPWKPTLEPVVSPAIEVSNTT